MFKYLLLFFLFNYFLCRDYWHLNDDNVTFPLEGNNEFGFYMKYNDIFERYDNAKKNNFYFLEVNKGLKLNCVKTKGEEEPDEATLNRTFLNKECQLSIELEEEYNLVAFPKTIEKDERLYFIAFNDNTTEYEYFYYIIKRIPYPKYFEITENIIESYIKGINIYLMRQEPQTYSILCARASFPILIYGYKNETFEQLSYIREDNYFFFN